jgi:hypothetical protein
MVRTMPKPKQSSPKPRTVTRSAARVCGAGHHQTLKWQPGDPCQSCIRDEKLRALEDPTAAAAFRAKMLGELPRLPETFTMGGVTFSARPRSRRR